MNELGWILSPIFTLIGVFVGWFLSKRSQEKMLRVSEIRNELEKAYGPVYSIISRPEQKVKVDERGSLESRVAISPTEKMELDRILKSYPHMFPPEIIVLWRTEIRDSWTAEIAVEGCEDLEPFGISRKFKEKITEEYYKRLEEYYKITGREKSLKGLPKWARP